MSERECRIPALDGLLIGASLFEPIGERRRRAVLIASATGSKRERYREFARYLAGRGWSVVTFDYRGIGDSRAGAVKLAPYTMFDWGAKDIAGVIDWIQDQWSPTSLVAVGHSIGGQIFPFARNHDQVQALLAISAQKGYWPLWQGIQKFECFAFWCFIPIVVRLLGYLPMGFAGCEDLPPAVALEWQRWGMHDDFLDADGRSLGHHHAAFRAPILAYSFADDPYAPRAATERLLRFYCQAQRQHRHVLPADLGLRAIGHSGFFSDPTSEPLWQEACEWLVHAGTPAAELVPRRGDDKDPVAAIA